MQVLQWVVALAIEGEVASVFEAAADEQRGQVVIRVRVGAAHVGAVEAGGVVEQGLVLLVGRAEAVEECGERLEVRFLDAAEFGDLLRLPTVVCKRVCAAADSGDAFGREIAGGKANGDDACRVGSSARRTRSSMARALAFKSLTSAMSFGGAVVTSALGSRPALAGGQAGFEIANGGGELVEALTVIRADALLQRFELILDAIEQAAVALEAAQDYRAALDGVFDKKLLIQRDGTGDRRIVGRLRVQERLRLPVPIITGSDGKRVALPVFSAMTWSSETLCGRGRGSRPVRR